MAAPWTVMPLISRLLYRVSQQRIRVLCSVGPRGSPETGEDMRRDSRDLLRRFPKPKEILYNAITKALRSSDIKDKLTYITASSNPDHKVILRIKWPKLIEVEGCGGRKVDAERHAAAQACQIFQDLGLLGSGRKFWQKKLRAAPDEYSAADEDPMEVQGGQWGTRKVRAARTEQRLPSLDSEEELAAKRALMEFPSPKHLLSTVVQVATSSSGSKDYVQYQHEGGHIKTCRLTLTWPQPFTFVAHGLRRTEAEKKVAALACQKLKELGLLDENNNPLSNAMYNLSAVQKLRERHRQARWFNVPEDLLVRMENYFQEFPLESQYEFESDEPEHSVSEMESTDDWSSVSDPITGQPYTPLSEYKADEISHSLNAKWLSSQVTPLQELPADDHKKTILAAIDANPVVVIAGDTGCGKTTRIPRFVLEDAILSGRGAHCNILITQPRRISAVSVAHRVGQELGPALRRNAGYQVRLESMLPPRGGALLFCTVGVLLKKLQTNAALEGVSHVIVDEVHERDVSTDFLLILLKQMLEINPNIKVILMSATGDNHRISKYFGNCPIVRVPGFMYPVKQHYLEDILRMIRVSSYRPPATNDECIPDLELISKVILHIDQHGEPGSILCFLPGWQEIRGVQEILQGALSYRNGQHLILPVLNGISILQVSCLETSWVSKSNVTQRRGRAGRCQPGHSYHLFTRQQYQAMAEFQVPEILRTPLENLVLQAKIHTPEMTAVEFLSQALECPEKNAIRDAVQLLQEIRVLDEQEELTSLGQRVAHITTDPSLAKAIVLSAIYRCLQPLLIIVACLTKDPFLGGIVNRVEVDKVKTKFSGEACSDHLAFVWIYQAWKEVLKNNLSREEFLQDNVLSRSSLRFIQGLISQFSSNAQDAYLVPDSSHCVKDDALCNQLSNQYELVKGVLLAGLYPKLIQVRRGQVIRGKFRPNSLLFKTKGGPVHLHKSTLNRDNQHFRSPWLTYFQAVKSTGAVFVRDSSMVHPLAVLLMADSSIAYRNNGQQMVVYLSDSDLLKLESDTRTMRLLGTLRQALHQMVKKNLNNQDSLLSAHEEHRHSQLLSLLVDLLNTTADCFGDPSEAEE
ncbi:ATP-dependent RNA helicase DHX30 [Pyxicephalus adspersus]|uniref:ATP-dependent RNA helicase DHX30 n=1 Tax=Pyxicephalus adspersus TaxID=30357 RepID=UPI003B5C08D6